MIIGARVAMPMIANPLHSHPVSASAVPIPSTGSITNGSSSRALTKRAAALGSTSTRIAPSPYAWTNSACVIARGSAELQTHARDAAVVAGFTDHEFDAAHFETI